MGAQRLTETPSQATLPGNRKGATRKGFVRPVASSLPGGNNSLLGIYAPCEEPGTGSAPPLLASVRAPKRGLILIRNSLIPLAVITLGLTLDLNLGSFPSAQDNASDAPPGMVFIRGSRTYIGSKEDDIEKMVIENDGNYAVCWAETPMHERRVPDFYLQITEVTNEQFAEFVAATGKRPPEYWGRAAIDAAQREHLTIQGEAAKKAREEGKPLPEKELFNRSNWWAKNWKGAKWELPKGSEAKPVTYVSYEEAEAYARWAGLRLMDEYEFTRAARGNTKNNFVWGETWSLGHASTIEAGRDLASSVGSFPSGATEEGVLDLLGNVWEWTSSRFEAYPRHKRKTLTIKDGRNSRKLELLVDFDANSKVTMGGSFTNPYQAARIPTRRGAEPDQSTNALGFRCAASLRRGEDISRWVVDDDIRGSKKSEEGYQYELTAALDKWTWRQGTAKETWDREVGSQMEDAKNPLEAYSVITGYDYILFTPVADVPASSVKELQRRTVDGEPEQFGVFSTTVPIMDPPLAAGSYIIAWRGDGIARKKNDDKDDENSDSEARAAEEPEATIWDPKVQNIVIYSADGEPLVALPDSAIKYERLREGEITIESVPADTKKGVVAHDAMQMVLATSAGRRSFHFELNFKLAPGTINDSWRK